ncbi:hypothetical protein E3O25_14325 [Cryobacterium sp. TMT1-3]|uniref:hypothetical protein n=1 Tax=Cryobacterium sp. TMT1-3 TaxID=1259237 RepID=UPI00106C9312|nr:hypothetical protein [Cryobacterium sp. TMT1-3]TFC25171.1 hypothetical protein E3O25_14325 [Cryobacterium sp. TMT1-3]
MKTVEGLNGDESGVWRVTTVCSSYIVNFQRGTVTRIPGVGSNVTFNDFERPLRTLDTCKVGEAGYWTMKSEDSFADYYTQQSTTIVRIALLTGIELGKAMTDVALQNIHALDGLYSMTDVATMLNVEEPKIRVMLATDQLIALIWREEIVFPGCQFGPDRNHIESFVLPLVSAAADLDFSGFGLTFWLYTPTTYFGGDRPLSHLDEPERLVEAFIAHASIEW